MDLGLLHIHCTSLHIYSTWIPHRLHIELSSNISKIKSIISISHTIFDQLAIVQTVLNYFNQYLQILDHHLPLYFYFFDCQEPVEYNKIT